MAFPSQGKYTDGDGGSDYDVFVHDRITGKTRRASLKSNGKEVNGQDCLNHSISANGNLVAFTCDGAMVGSDNNGYHDVYVKNMSSGKIVRASVKSDGSEIPAGSGLPSISADGRYVAFVTDGALVGSDTNGVEDVYRHDLKTGKTIRISLRSNGDQTDHDSTDPSISGDGNRVAFASLDGSMTPDTDYANAVDSDVFVRDVKAQDDDSGQPPFRRHRGVPNNNQSNISRRSRPTAVSSPSAPTITAHSWPRT